MADLPVERHRSRRGQRHPRHRGRQGGGHLKVLVDFAKSSVKASEEQAKADRQRGRCW